MSTSSVTQAVLIRRFQQSYPIGMMRVRQNPFLLPEVMDKLRQLFIEITTSNAMWISSNQSKSDFINLAPPWVDCVTYVSSNLKKSLDVIDLISSIYRWTCAIKLTFNTRISHVWKEVKSSFLGSELLELLNDVILAHEVYQFFFDQLSTVLSTERRYLQLYSIVEHYLKVTNPSFIIRIANMLRQSAIQVCVQTPDFKKIWDMEVIKTFLGLTVPVSYRNCLSQRLVFTIIVNTYLEHMITAKIKSLGRNFNVRNTGHDLEFIRSIICAYKSNMGVRGSLLIDRRPFLKSDIICKLLQGEHSELSSVKQLLTAEERKYVNIERLRLEDSENNSCRGILCCPSSLSLLYFGSNVSGRVGITQSQSRISETGYSQRIVENEYKLGSPPFSDDL